MKSVFWGSHHFPRSKLTKSCFKQTPLRAIAPALIATLTFAFAGCMQNGKRITGTLGLSASLTSGTGTGTSTGTPQIIVAPSPALIPKNGMDTTGQIKTLQMTASGPGATAGVTWEVANAGPASIDPLTGVLTPATDAVGSVVVRARSNANSNSFVESGVTIYQPMTITVDNDVLSYNDKSATPPQQSNFTLIRVSYAQRDPLSGLDVTQAELVSGASSGLMDCAIANSDPNCRPSDGTTHYFKFAAPDAADVNSGSQMVIQIRVHSPLRSSIEPDKTEDSKIIKIYVNPRIHLDVDGGNTTISVGGTLQFIATQGAAPITYTVTSGHGRIGATTGLYTAPSQIGTGPNDGKYTVAAVDALGNVDSKDGMVIQGMTFNPGIAVSQPDANKTTVFKVLGGEPATDGSYLTQVYDNYKVASPVSLATYAASGGLGSFTAPSKKCQGDVCWWEFSYQYPGSMPADLSSLRITITATEPSNPKHFRTAQIAVSQKMDVIQNSIDGLRFGETAEVENEGYKRTRVFDVVGGIPPYIVKPCSKVKDQPSDLSYYFTITQLADAEYGSRFKVDGSRLNIKDFRDMVVSGKKPWLNKVGSVCFWDQTTAPDPNALDYGKAIRRTVNIEQGPLVIPSTGNKQVTSMITDPSGNMYLSGWIDAGGTIGTVAADPVHRSGFILRVNANGVFSWVHIFKDSDLAARMIKTDGTGCTARTFNASAAVQAGNREIAKIRYSKLSVDTQGFIYFIGNAMPADGNEIGLLGRIDSTTGGTSELSLSEHQAECSPTRIDTLDINPSDALRNNTQDSAGNEINFLATNKDTSNATFWTKDDKGATTHASTRVGKGVHFSSLAIYPNSSANRVFVTGKLTSDVNVYTAVSYQDGAGNTKYQEGHPTGGTVTRTDAFVSAFDYLRASTPRARQMTVTTQVLRNFAGRSQILLPSPPTVQEASFLRSSMDQNDEATDLIYDSAARYPFLVTGTTAASRFHTTESNGEPYGGAYGGMNLFATAFTPPVDGLPIRTYWAYTIGGGGTDRGGKIGYGPQYKYHDDGTPYSISRHVYFTGTIGKTASAGGPPEIQGAGGYLRDRSVLIKLDPNPETNLNRRAVVTFAVTMVQDSEWIGSLSTNATDSTLTPIAPSFVARDPYKAFYCNADGSSTGCDARNQREGLEDRATARVFMSTPVQKPFLYRYFSYFTYQGCTAEAPFVEDMDHCVSGTQLPRRGHTPLSDYTLHDTWPVSAATYPGGVFLNAMALHPNPKRYTILNAGTVNGLYYDGVSKSGADGLGNETDILILELDPLSPDSLDPVYLSPK